jgi:hypothetical protein
MIRRLVIHIGDHKAGSTAIQRALLAGALRPDAGAEADDPPPYLYPTEKNHNGLARALVERGLEDRADRAFARIARAFAQSEAEVGILSAEEFEAVPPAILRDRIARHFPDLADSLRIVAYVRPHAERLVASHAELVKVGLFLGTLEEYFARTLENRKFFYTPRFEAWRDTFGDDFVLRPLVPGALAADDVVADFLGLALPGRRLDLVPQPRANPTLPIADLAVLRTVQQALEGRPRRLRHRVGWALAEALAADPGAVAARPALHAGLAARVVAAYAGDAAALDAAFFRDGFAEGPMAAALAGAPARAAAEPYRLALDAHYDADTRRLVRALARLAGALTADRTPDRAADRGDPGQAD